MGRDTPILAIALNWDTFGSTDLGLRATCSGCRCTASEASLNPIAPLGTRRRFHGW
jgi:hypothetical protein